MSRRRVLDVIIKTWDEVIKEREYPNLKPDKNIMAHINYEDKFIGIGSENPENHDGYQNIDNICGSINHEVIHWVLYYREDRFIPERRADGYKTAACTTFDNICRGLGLRFFSPSVG